MTKEVLTALRTAIVTLIVTGLLYPLVVTLLANAFFHTRATGSIVLDPKGRPIGSELIAQRFSNAAYFQPRPSSAGDAGFDAERSSGSNLGPTSEKLRARVLRDVARLLAENPDAKDPVPVELVTTSASGLDPHLSPSAALWQAPRIARARNVSRDRVKAIVEDNVETPDLGLFGDPTVNVLALNLALDKSFGRPAKTSTAAVQSSTTAKAP